MIKNIILVGLGGFAGSVARYLVYVFIDRNLITPLVWSTFIVNIVGSLLLGLIIGLSTKMDISNETRLFLSVGFCGSFTTFSTFAMENLQFLQDKPWFYPATYITASIALGVSAAFLGFVLGK